MNYDQIGIDMFGEEKIERILERTPKINLFSKDEKNAELIYAIENYILKYQDKPKSKILKDNINIIKNQLLEIFKDNPLAINYSVILTNNELANFTEEQKKIFEHGKEKLSKNINQIYTNIMNDIPVSEYEKNRLMTYFSLMISNKKNLNYREKKVMEKIKKYTEKVLKTNEIPTSDYELKFLCDYITTYTFSYLGYHELKPIVRIVDIKNSEPNTFKGGYNYGMYIAINRKKSNIKGFHDTLEHMLQSASHEATHAVQLIESYTKKDSIRALEMTIQQLFGMKEYKTGNNYLFNEIEVDAQKMGYEITSIFYGLHGRNDIAKQLLKDKSEYIKGRKFQYEYVTVSNNDGTKSKMSKEKYNVENIRNIVARNFTELSNRFPSIKNLFHKDGSSKTLIEMLEERNISHDIEKMYKDFIIYEIRHSNLNDLNLESKTKEQKRTILHRLNNILSDMINNAINILNDYKYRKMYPKETAFFYNIYLKDIIKISTFIDKYLEYMRNDEKDLKHDSIYINYTRYTSEIRKLLYNIELTKQKNKMTNLENINKNYQQELSKIEENIKREYINFLLSLFTNKEKNTLIVHNNNTYTLEYFIKNILSSQMDINHYIHNETGEILKDEKENPLIAHAYAKKVLNSSINKIPSFEEVHRFANKYIVKTNPKNLSEFIVIDSDTSQIVNDANIKENAIFAAIWLSAAGQKVYTNEKRAGETYAFNEPAKRLYEFLGNEITKNLLENGSIDTINLVNKGSELNYKHAQDIIIKLFRTTTQTNFISNYFCKALSITEKTLPIPLYNMQHAGKLTSKKH